MSQMTRGRETRSQMSVRGVGVWDQEPILGLLDRGFRLGVAASAFEGEAEEGAGRGVGCDRVDTIFSARWRVSCCEKKMVVVADGYICERRWL